MPSALVAELQRICGQDNVFWRPDDLIVFEYDAGFDRQPPSAVVVPATAEEVAGVVRAAKAASVPVVARGAGTGLSGGTVACAGALVVSTNRLDRIIRIDPQAR
ncbi:MAG: FAD-binding oxidoreductase, partial [Chloroflexota bacterium]|nr:FAD-binding oxidoreductase [Chloroflexota bacterium]